MSHDRLYRPAPCSSWPGALLEVVGATYRAAAGQGLDTMTCLDLTITSMIASLSRESGDWFWGPMDEWWAMHPALAADEACPFEPAPW
ncbi:hypothetical protein ACFQX4_24870 [Roseomonas sp. GCM10028921]